MSLKNISKDSRKTRGGETPSERIAKLPVVEIPNRYSIRHIGSEKALSCIEAPNLCVFIKLGLSFSPSAIGKAAPGTIYLDGVAQSGPFLDHAKHVYNFDHHEGCVRLFTLSTCEQVLLMIKKGLDLRSRDWKIYANDPDLDTVLAIWLLLNHLRINEQESIRENILFPLVRLQGGIDSLGLEMKMLTGLPSALLNQIQRIIDHLRRKEVRIKKDALWEDTDFLEYTVDVLREIDQIVYDAKKLDKSLEIEELARVSLLDNRVAVVLQSDLGIYEIEPHLKKIYGDTLALVFLRKSPATFTVRQVDPFLDRNLENVYERLNFVDPAVKNRGNNNKWGGSTDIGGSPRESGTQMTPEEIAKTCRDVFQKKTFTQMTLLYAFVVSCCAVVISVADGAAAYWSPVQWFNNPGLDALVSDPYFAFSVVMLLLTSLVLVCVSGGRLWQFGISPPEGKSWWALLPAAMLPGFVGGPWMPMGSVSLPELGNPRLLLACILLPLAAEYLFRSVLHGIIAQVSKIQHNASRYFLSWPNLGTSFLYCISLTFFPVLQSGTASPLIVYARSPLAYIGAFIFSIVLGFVRERSHSFFMSYLFHMMTAFLSVFLPALLMHAR